MGIFPTWDFKGSILIYGIKEIDLSDFFRLIFSYDVIQDGFCWQMGHGNENE